MKISIIGCGWLGLPVANNLTEYGYEVHGTTTSEEKLDLFSEKGIIPHLVDLKQPEQDLSFINGSDCVLISFPPGLRKPTHSYQEQIEQLITNLRQYFVQKVVFISSTSVYPSEGVFTEDSSITASTDRQKILLETELLLIDHFDASVIRMGGLYGDNRLPHRFVKAPSQLEVNTEINFIHQDDAVKLTTKVLLSKVNGIFNGVHPDHPKKYDFYQDCFKKVNIEFNFPPPISESQRIVNSKRMNEISFEFKHPTHSDYLNS